MDLGRFKNSPVGDLHSISGTDGRTGRSSIHSAFVAHPLAAEPELTSRTWHRISEASAELGRLDQAGKLIPRPGILRRPLLRREAQSTSNLEGTYVPLDEVLAADSQEQGVTSSLREVLNYERAATVAFAAIDSGASITSGLLSQAQKTIVHWTRDEDANAGMIRSTQVAIGAGGESLDPARFFPMPPGPMLVAAVQDLVDWIETPATHDRDPIVGAAMAHYQFETLHPYTNGNGRVGRLLIVLQLMRRGVLSEPLLALSPWFDAHRTTYHDLLSEVSASGNWNAWIAFFAQAVAASARDSARRAHRLLEVQQEYVDTLAKAKATGAIRDIVDLLVESPYITIQEASERVGRTYQGVRLAFGRLVDLGILDVSGKRKGARLFVAREMVYAVIAPPDWN